MAAAAAEAAAAEEAEQEESEGGSDDEDVEMENEEEQEQQEDGDAAMPDAAPGAAADQPPQQQPQEPPPPPPPSPPPVPLQSVAYGRVAVLYASWKHSYELSDFAWSVRTVQVPQQEAARGKAPSMLVQFCLIGLTVSACCYCVNLSLRSFQACSALEHSSLVHFNSTLLP